MAGETVTILGSAISGALIEVAVKADATVGTAAEGKSVRAAGDGATATATGNWEIKVGGAVGATIIVPICSATAAACGATTAGPNDHCSPSGKAVGRAATEGAAGTAISSETFFEDVGMVMAKDGNVSLGGVGGFVCATVITSVGMSPNRSSPRAQAEGMPLGGTTIVSDAGVSANVFIWPAGGPVTDSLTKDDVFVKAAGALDRRPPGDPGLGNASNASVRAANAASEAVLYVVPGDLGDLGSRIGVFVEARPAGKDNEPSCATARGAGDLCEPGVAGVAGEPPG